MINIINVLISYIAAYLYINILTKIVYDLNIFIINYLKNVSLSYFSNVDTINLTQKVNVDSNNLISFCINTLIDVIVKFLIILLVAFLLFKINYIIFIILFLLVVSYSVIYAIFKKTMYKRIFEVKEAQSDFFSKLNEQLYNVKFIKYHAVDELFKERLDKSFSKLILNQVSLQKYNSLYVSCDTIIGIIAQITIYLIGGFIIINGHMTIGMFVVLTSYFSLIMSSIRYFFNLGKTYQDSLVSYDRLDMLLKTQKQSNGDTIINKIEYIKIDNLSFVHGEKKIFNNYNVEFYKGNIYGINGSNGVGKSTLINLLLGMYINDYEGKISYNDIDIKDLDMYQLRLKNIGIVEQEPILIPDTLINNLTLGKNYDKGEINDLLKFFDMYNYVLALENGIETVINEKSNNISGGEKQKISIIRELLKNPDILIFDEPTSAIDYEGKNNFIRYINKIKSDKIIIIITHDDYINNIASEVIFIK